MLIYFTGTFSIPEFYKSIRNNLECFEILVRSEMKFGENLYKIGFSEFSDSIFN